MEVVGRRDDVGVEGVCVDGGGGDGGQLWGCLWDGRRMWGSKLRCRTEASAMEEGCGGIKGGRGKERGCGDGGSRS